LIELAEKRAESLQLRIAERLAAEAQYQVFEPRLANA